MIGAICSAGTYSPAGASSCATCAEGTYSSSGAASCTTCPAGTYCPYGSPSFNLCPAGTFSNAGAPQCTGCPSGTYCPNPGSTVANQLICPSGTYCPFNAATGTANYTNCTGGTFSGWTLQSASVAFATPYNHSDPTRQPTPASVGASCTACPNGYSCSAPITTGGIVSQAAPALCPGPDAGEGQVTYHVDITTYTSCTLCPAGSSCTLPNIQPVRYSVCRGENASHMTLSLTHIRLQTEPLSRRLFLARWLQLLYRLSRGIQLHEQLQHHRAGALSARHIRSPGQWHLHCLLPWIRMPRCHYGRKHPLPARHCS
jgi:hypothetical protein